jgi:membrane carboxypeptidase/penicillin-binding protein PbpC
VSASDALVRSLNLPAVQVLEAYGPKRFAARLRNAGLPLMLPAGAEPNLSLILGGAARGWRISWRRTARLPATARRTIAHHAGLAAG